MGTAVGECAGGLNGGGPMLKMSTASGNIQIKRASR